MIVSFCRINVEERKKKKQALTFPIFKHWSSLVKTGRSPISWAQKTLYQTRDLLVRTSLWGILLVLTNNVLAAKANTTLACERNPMATVRFSFITVTQPQHPSGVQFYRKKKMLSKKWMSRLSKPVMGFLTSSKQSELRKDEVTVSCSYFCRGFFVETTFLYKWLKFRCFKEQNRKITVNLPKWNNTWVQSRRKLLNVFQFRRQTEKIDCLHTISVLSSCSSQCKTKGLQRNKEATEKLKGGKYLSFILNLNTN